jgi:hypothetical protein
MKANQPDPLLQALFDDDAWRASCRETQTRAGARLRRRRCWRKLRAGVAVIAMAAGGWWLACHGERSLPPSTGHLAGEARPIGELHLQLALNPPVAADGPLTVPAYQPLPDWTFHCEPLADSSRATPSAFLPSHFSDEHERELH